MSTADDFQNAVLFDNVAMSVTDIERSTAWYSDILGFRVVFREFLQAIESHFVILERGPLRVELLSRASTARNPAAAIPAGPHIDTTGLKAIVFRTEKLVDFTKFLETKNVQFEWKLKTLSESGMLATMIRDPDGNMINVLQYGESSPQASAD